MEGTGNKEEYVRHVFETISHSYDDANNRISLGLQKHWKKKLTNKMLHHIGKQDAVLDVCCGTGDIAISLSSHRPSLRVMGLDFSPAMLEMAREKGKGMPNLTWREGNAEAIPFPNDSFSCACISFGLRNTSDYDHVLREMKRVVRPGGWVYCLDSFVPDSPLIQPFYELYFRGVMPLLGGGNRYREEYLWLWKSTREFLKKDQLLALFQRAGLERVDCSSYLFGACALHQGQKAI